MTIDGPSAEVASCSFPYASPDKRRRVSEKSLNSDENSVSKKGCIMALDSKVVKHGEL